MLSKETEYEYVEKAKTDPHYLGLVIKHFDILIRKQSTAYARPGIDEQDLYQQGVLGLHRAVQEFKPKKGKRFSTLARWWVKAFLSDFYRNNSRAFSISGALSTELNTLMKVQAQLENENGREATYREIAEARGISLERLEFLLKFKNHAESLNAVRSSPSDESNDESMTIGSSLADDHCDSPRERAIRNDCVNCIRSAISKLPLIQQKVITHRYDLDGTGEKTLSETGKLLDLSAEGVRQIQCAAEKKLKRIMER